MANSIKTDYMNTPNLGYSEYFIKNASDLSALSPKPGDRAIVADNGAIYLCIEKGQWNKFGNTVPSGEVVIASDINEDSTNDEVAGAGAVWELVSEKTANVEKTTNKVTSIDASSSNNTYPSTAAVYAYGQQIKEEGGGGGETVQSDWEQNDSSKKDYIKNRICYEENIVTESLTVSGSKTTPVVINGQTYYYFWTDKKLNWEDGMVIPYSVPSIIPTASFTVSEISYKGQNFIGLNNLDTIGGAFVADGAKVDLVNETIELGDYFTLYFPIAFETATIDSVSQTEIHQIPQKFIPSPMKNYSYDEHLIGTWVNGNNLYEKTISVDITSNGEIEVDIAETNINKIVDISYICTDTNNGLSFNGNYTDPSGTSAIIYILAAPLELSPKLYVNTNNNVFDFPIQMYITLKYTKTS